LGDFSRSHAPFTIKNKKIDAKTMEIALGKRYTGIEPQVNLSYRVSNFLEWTVSTGYIFNIWTNDKIRVVEKSGSLFARKQVNASLTDAQELIVRENGQPTGLLALDIKDYYLSTGLVFSIGR
jgi:hypothetical protein